MSFGQPKHLGLDKTKTSCRGREERALTPDILTLGWECRQRPYLLHFI